MILKNIAALYTCPLTGGQDRVGAIKNAALVWEGAKITWLGPQSELPGVYRESEALDAKAGIVIPGLVDCHTHLCFGGWRADEFEARILGRSYAEIAAQGGGILSTVKQTRAASKEDLTRKCLGCLQQMLALGITTVECKSGYGLNLESEIKILEVYKELSTLQPISLVPTFLGAHTVPPEFKTKRAGYVDLVVNQMLPQVAERNLAKFCDVFVDSSAFRVEEARRILEAGQRLGLRPRLHADQFRDGQAAALAAELNALSADHLEFAAETALKAMQAKGVVAVLLPLAALATNSPPLNARKLIQIGINVAVSTDFNPGTAPTYHLPYVLSLACLLNHLTPAEALKSATVYAAQALGLEREIGSVEIGKAADFVVIDAPDVNSWLSGFREQAVLMTVKSGVGVFEAAGYSTSCGRAGTMS